MVSAETHDRRSAPHQDGADEYAVDPGRLRAARQARGLSQQRLAARCGVRQQHLSGMERRPTRARLGTVMRLAAGLGLAPGELLVGGAAALGPALGSGHAAEAQALARLASRLDALGRLIAEAHAVADELRRAHQALRQALDER
jgi:transcriptional regulator with XRE-family HTH domain